MEIRKCHFTRTIAIILISLGVFINCQDQVSVTDGAATIACQPNEIRHYDYNSVNDLWGENGGTIELKANLNIHCLGSDIGGTYGENALKYLVEIPDLEAKPIVTDSGSSLRRSKRGIGDWFRNAWEKVKNFFKRVFGGGESDSGQSAQVKVEPVATENPNLRKVEEEEVEIFDPRDYQGLFNTPFEFIQLPNGTIPEIRFAANDTDEGSRNFKRHLADIFATHVNSSDNSVEEDSPLGKHNTRYSYKTSQTTSTTTSTTTEMPITILDILTVTRKITTDDILSLTPAENHAGRKGFNSIKNLDLDAVQIQKYLAGELISSEGELNLLVNEIDSKKRKKRGTKSEQDSTGVEVKSRFTFSLSKRRKREIHEISQVNKMEEELKFVPNSMTSTVTRDDTAIKNRMESLEAELLNNFEHSSIESLANTDNTQIVSTVLELLELNQRLKIETKDCKICEAIKKFVTAKEVGHICDHASKRPCSIALMIVAAMGGNENQKILLDFLQSWSKSDLNTPKIARLSQSLTLLDRPNQDLLDAVVNEIISSSSSNNSRADLLIPIVSSLLQKTSVSPEVQASTVNKLGDLLSNRTQYCGEDGIAECLIETLGSTGIWNRQLLELAQKCPLYKINVIKALETSMDSEDIRNWIAAELSNCTGYFKQVVAEMLLKILKRAKSNDDDVWPLTKFNNLDKQLHVALFSNSSSSVCKNAIYKYFASKDCRKAEDIVSKYLATVGKNHHRQKRDIFWNDENCDDWMSHRVGSKEPLDAFEENGVAYNRWRHCSAHQSFGKSIAKAEFNGGMFAGVKFPSEPSKYRIQAKMAGDASFLGKTYEVGVASFSIDEKKTKAYVELLGRTLLDLKGNDCKEDEFLYRPAHHIPLYSFNLWLLEISLGIHLGVDATMNFECPQGGAFKFNPSSRVRVAGEAFGKILMLKGGINLGGNFNYHLKSRLEPYPDACFSAQQGFDPMSVSVEPWFQFYRPAFLGGWSRRQVWQPSFLKWNVGPGIDAAWTKYYCALPDARTENETTMNTTPTNNETS